MKRILILAVCVMLILSGCGIKEVYELSTSKGRVLICDNGSFMCIVDGSPILLDVSTLKDVDKYTDGDLIRVWHDGVEESYPARTKAYKIKLIEKGMMADVDPSVAQNLCDMGWIEYDDMVQRYADADYIINCDTPSENVTCEYLYCDMSLNIPDNWTYEVKESDDECYIRFRPDSEMEGWVVLECHSMQFAVCGTGLETKETRIGGYSASVGYYYSDGIFSFIRFNDTSGEYVVRNVSNNDWFSEHENEIMSILDTVVLSPEQLRVDEVAVLSDLIIAEYEERYIWFDCFSGEWVIDVYKDNVYTRFKLNAEGDVISQPK